MPWDDDPARILFVVPCKIICYPATKTARTARRIIPNNLYFAMILRPHFSPTSSLIAIAGDRDKGDE